MFAQMLATQVQPLSARQPACEKRQRDAQKAKCMKPAHVARHNASLAKYRKAMGDEWVSTQVIESRLGFARASALGTLREWEEDKIVERRKVGGDENWNLRRGYEWRFK